MRPQGKIDPNNLKVSLVPLTLLCGTYPLAKNRSDMGCEEYTRYKMDWERFEYIWAYNYTVSTVRQASPKDTTIHPYLFLNNNERIAYKNGQSAHAAVYSSAATVFQDFTFV